MGYLLRLPPIVSLLLCRDFTAHPNRQENLALGSMHLTLWLGVLIHFGHGSFRKAFPSMFMLELVPGIRRCHLLRRLRWRSHTCRARGRRGLSGSRCRSLLRAARSRTCTRHTTATRQRWSRGIFISILRARCDSPMWKVGDHGWIHQSPWMLLPSKKTKINDWLAPRGLLATKNQWSFECGNSFFVGAMSLKWAYQSFGWSKQGCLTHIEQNLETVGMLAYTILGWRIWRMNVHN